MRIAISSLLASATIAAMGLPAYAGGPAGTSPVTLKFGAYAAQNVGTGYYIGLDYAFGSRPSSSPGPFSAYADFLGGGASREYSRSSGFGLAARSGGAVFFGAGAGIYNVSYTPPTAAYLCPPLPQGCPNSNPTVTANGLGGKIFVGTNLGKGADVEIDYDMLPAVPYYRVNGVTLEIGLRL